MEKSSQNLNIARQRKAAEKRQPVTIELPNPFADEPPDLDPWERPELHDDVMDMFKIENSPPDTDAFYAEGWVAAELRKPADANPHAADSIEARAWARGWHGYHDDLGSE
jgi:hypothetical protein